MCILLVVSLNLVTFDCKLYYTKIMIYPKIKNDVKDVVGYN